MKICKIWIKDWDQFKDIELDFTDPATGEPAEKICFIGSNGTGKSKLLGLIKELIHQLSNWTSPLSGNIIFSSIVKIKYLNEFYFIIYKHEYEKSYEGYVLKWKDFHNTLSFAEIFNKTISKGWQNEFEEIAYDTFLEDKLKDVLWQNAITIYSPTESINNAYAAVDDLPRTTLQEALSSSISFPKNLFVVSPETLVNFWNLLIVNIKHREDERNKFENTPENLVKIKQKLVDEFNKINPRIEDKLAKVWNTILNKAKLELDVEKIKSPVQVKDNLEAYITLQDSQKIIPYQDISVGIRNYIFRLGHIYSLYFNREIDTGFLLVDEPENSLYPDFLYDIIDIYKEVCTDKRGQMNTQMFFATHSPMVASQFKKHERLILDWNDDGTVNASKGYSPEGDDATDILANDFGSRTMPKKGEDMFKEYLILKRELEKTSDLKEKTKIYQKLEQIGSEYNFL